MRNAPTLVVFMMVCILTSASKGAKAQELRRPYGVPAIFTMDKDGSYVQLLVRRPEMEWHGTASWSNDGKRILFDCSPGWRDFTRCNIFVTALDGSFEQDLGSGAAPSWSPDDKNIVFHVRPTNTAGIEPGIWVMDADGENRVRICDGWRPRCSPDGKKLVYASRHEGFPSIYVRTIEKNESERLLEKQYSYITGGDWSPDGKRIVFIGYKGNYNNGELGIITLDGKQNIFSVRVAGRVGWQPSWSPDGKQIVFYMKDKTDARRLHVVSPDDNKPPVLLKNQADVYYNAGAEWSPDGKRIVFARAR